MRSSTLLLLACALVLAACGGSSTTSSAGKSTSASATKSTSASATTTAPPGATTGAGTTPTQPAIGFEGVPLESGSSLAPAGTTGTATVDGIQCGSTEQLVYHIHAHLAVFLDGKQYALPGGVGIPGSVIEQTPRGPVAAGGRCIYWLHTHTSDGVIHVESPTRRIYTLGEFFDEWQQPLTATRVGGAQGRITAYVNGQPWTKSVRAIPLVPRAVIQFNIGEPAPPLMTVNWSNTGL